MKTVLIKSALYCVTEPVEMEEWPDRGLGCKSETRQATGTTYGSTFEEVHLPTNLGLQFLLLISIWECSGCLLHD